jgi:hypothetical protein
MVKFRGSNTRKDTTDVNKIVLLTFCNILKLLSLVRDR